MTPVPRSYCIGLVILLATAGVSDGDSGMEGWRFRTQVSFLCVSRRSKWYHLVLGFREQDPDVGYLPETHLETLRGNKWLVFKYLVSLTVPVTETRKLLAGHYFDLILSRWLALVAIAAGMTPSRRVSGPFPVPGDGGWGVGGKNVGVIPTIKEIPAEVAKQKSRSS